MSSTAMQILEGLRIFIQFYPDILDDNETIKSCDGHLYVFTPQDYSMEMCAHLDDLGGWFPFFETEDGLQCWALET